MRNWFKNKSAAKKALKQARKDESLVRKAYSVLGI